MSITEVIVDFHDTGPLLIGNNRKIKDDNLRG